MDRLFKINRTLIRKLQDTAYQVSAEELKAASDRAAFEQQFSTRDSLERIFYPLPDSIASLKTPTGVLLCFAELEEGKKQIQVKDTRRLIARMETSAVNHALFITNGPLSTKAKEMLEAILVASPYQVTLFRDEEFFFNRVLHRRIPKHEVLLPAEAEAFLALTKLKRSQLPRIYEDDPQAKYHGATPGDLMRITNPSPTVGQFTRHVYVARRVMA